MFVSKNSLDVIEGEEYTIMIDGAPETQTYSWVVFYEDELIYRHFKTFASYKEAYAMKLKIYFKANANGVVELNPEHWGVFENNIAC